MVRNFIQQVMIPKVEAGQFEQVIDYKTRLQEILQIHGDVLITYEVTSESGPAHAKEFEVQVSVNGKSSVKDVAGLKRLQNKKQQKKQWRIRWIPHVFKGN